MNEEEPKIVTPTADEVKAYGGTAAAPGSCPEGNLAAEATVPGPTTPEAGAAAGESTVKAELQEWKEKCMRAVAELANFRKRAARDHADSLKYASSDLIRSLLPVVDDLERVLESAEKHPENTAAIVDGVRMTLANFMKILKEHGVEPIEAQGQPFDPKWHEALMEQPSDDVPDRTCLHQAARGYRLHDRVLRPAKVVVSRKTDGAAPAAGPESRQA